MEVVTLEGLSVTWRTHLVVERTLGKQKDDDTSGREKNPATHKGGTCTNNGEKQAEYWQKCRLLTRCAHIKMAPVCWSPSSNWSTRHMVPDGRSAAVSDRPTEGRNARRPTGLRRCSCGGKMFTEKFVFYVRRLQWLQGEQCFGLVGK